MSEKRARKKPAETAPETQAAAMSEQTGGLECPGCGCRHLPVLYTRQHPRRIKRVRECRHCGRRIVSYERIPEGASLVSRPGNHED